MATIPHRLAPTADSLNAFLLLFSQSSLFVQLRYEKYKNCERFPVSKKPSAESFVLTVWCGSLATLASLGPACM
jgi:hypothetical protein